MFCTNCGKKLYDGDRFCGNCGRKVRSDAPAPKPVSSDVVFNPPFKVEAERRTSEIYRGFASETPAEEKPRRTEPVSFDWNLDGFPKENKKTEDINFNWDSVIERRNQQKREEQKVEERHTAPLPVVDKIDIRGMQEAEEDVRVRTPLFVEPLPEKKEDEPFFVEHTVPVKEEPEAAAPLVQEEPAVQEEAVPVKDVTPLEPGMEEIVQIPDIPDLILPETPVVQPAEEDMAVPEAEEDEEPPMTAEELERELFGENYRGIGAMAPEESMKSTAQLEKFYTYNKKNEEFQQLLDQEYERLRGMEHARRPDTESLEFTWATSLFPENSRVNKAEAVPAEADKPADKVAAELEPVLEPEAVPSDTIDFTVVREKARLQKLQEAVDGTAAEEPAAKTEPVQADAPAEVPEADVTAEPETAEAPEVSETPVQAEIEAVHDEPAAEEAEESAGDENHAEDCAEDQAEDAAPCTEESEPDQTDVHDENAKLRFSDVFPRESVADHSDDGSAGASLTAAKVSQIFDEEEDEPKKMNFFVKLIITILVVLILAEGVVLLAKLIAPDSAFSQKADALVERIIDTITGNGSEANPGGDDSTEVSGDITENTYITDLLTEKIELPDSIGEILEDAALKYDLDKKYAFEAIADTEAFENSDWLTSEDGETVTYAEGILDAIAGYYGQWQATNRDTSLVGINKLEIGEIRTGEEGYYVLCRLTFAGTDGDEVVKHVTAYVKISQNSMLLNQIEEEKL